MGGLNRFEFFAEQIMLWKFQDKINNDLLLEILCLFEISKFFIRLRKYLLSRNQILISEENIETFKKELQVSAGERRRVDELFGSDLDEPLESVKEENGSGVNAEKAQKKVSELLSDLKNKRYKSNKFNQDYEETLTRSHKKISVLNNLPIPDEMFSKSTEPNLDQVRIMCGEIIHISRPLIYCFLLRHFRLKSYWPYIISLLTDILRLFVQRRIRFYNKAEKEEFRARNKEMLICYLLRNPLYSNIVKKKIIIPFFDTFFKRLGFLKTFFLYIVEMRSSISLLM